MSTLAGWAGTPGGPVTDIAVLSQMLGAAWQDPAAVSTQCAEGVAAIATVRGAQPASVCREEGLLVAVTGNIYWKDRELAQRAADGNDAQAIAHAVRRDGERFLQQMMGSFALAVIDTVSAVTRLAIDPMGIERLCYAVRDGRLVFASSVQALRAHPAVQTRISQQAVFNYLYHHTVPAPLTIYDDVFKLEAGELLVFRRGHTERSRYWHQRFQDRSNAAVQDLVDEFHRVLKRGIARPLEHFDEIGAFLSGGTDSSCVTAAVTQARGKARTFAIGFDADGYDESGYAQITVDRFRSDHHHYYVTPQDVCEALPRVAAYYDEPFGNASAVPAYVCARFAREAGIRNLLAGDGGDEIFGGNERYRKQKVFEYWSLLPRALRSRLIEPLIAHFPLGGRIPPLRKLQSYIAQANIPLPDRLETYNFLHRELLDEIFAPEFLRAVDPAVPLQSQRSTWSAADCDSALNRMLFLDMKFTLADNDLRKVNGMCELAGVNAHFPLIDLEMVEFAARVPVNLKIKGHKLRWFFKHALKDTLAPETLSKSKHGFGLPFGVWLNDNPALHAMASESLERFKSRGYVRPEYVDALWCQHRAGHSSYFGTMIWICMALEQWLEAHP